MHAEDTDSADTKADGWRKSYKGLCEDFRIIWREL